MQKSFVSYKHTYTPLYIRINTNMRVLVGSIQLADTLNPVQSSCFKHSSTHAHQIKREQK